MPYYHVYIRFLQKKTREEDEAYELDLSKEQLKKNIVDPLLRGDHFMVDGCFIDANNVFAISINETEINSGTILGRARSYELDDYDPDFEEDYIINQGKNVTREFITQLPRKLRSGKREKKMESKNYSLFMVETISQ